MHPAPKTLIAQTCEPNLNVLQPRGMRCVMSAEGGVLVSGCLPLMSMLSHKFSSARVSG